MPTDVINRYASLSAWAYDLDKPIGHSFGDVEFLLGRLKVCSGPILEPCVGTGRVLIRLLEAGHDAEGFDASNEMLEICAGIARPAGSRRASARCGGSHSSTTASLRPSS